MSQYQNLQANDEDIVKIMASLSLEEGLKSTLADKETQTKLDVRKIVKIIELLLSDKMLYKNHKLKHKLLLSKNGWLQIKFLLKIKQVQNTLKEIDFFNRIKTDLLIKFIRTQLQLHPCSLMANRSFIRRKVPFIDKIKLVKPIEIEGYKEQLNMVGITQCLACVTEIYKFNFKIGQCWGFVYAAQPEKLLNYGEFQATRKMEVQNDDNHENQSDAYNLPFKAVSYEKLMQSHILICKDVEKKLKDQILTSLPKFLIDSELEVFNLKPSDVNFHPIINNQRLKTYENLMVESILQMNKQESENVQENIQRMREEMRRQQRLMLNHPKSGGLENDQKMELRIKFTQRIDNFIKHYRPNLWFNQHFLSKTPLSFSTQFQLPLSVHEERVIDQASNQATFKFK